MPGQVYFSNATAVIDGITGPINSPYWQSKALNIGTLTSTSILLNSGDAFVATYAATPMVVGPNIRTAVPPSPVFNGPAPTRSAVADRPRPGASPRATIQWAAWPSPAGRLSSRRPV